VHEVLGIASIEDSEGRGEAEVTGVCAQEVCRYRVEGAPEHAPGGAAPVRVCSPGECLDACEHLRSGAPGEREQQDARGIGATLHKVGDPVGDRQRLAGPGTGDDQQRAVAMGDCGALSLVEARVAIEVMAG
jgi:hypothetical protein